MPSLRNHAHVETLLICVQDTPGIQGVFNSLTANFLPEDITMLKERNIKWVLQCDEGKYKALPTNTIREKHSTFHHRDREQRRIMCFRDTSKRQIHASCRRQVNSGPGEGFYRRVITLPFTAWICYYLWLSGSPSLPPAPSLLPVPYPPSLPPSPSSVISG